MNKTIAKKPKLCQARGVKLRPYIFTLAVMATLAATAQVAQFDASRNASFTLTGNAVQEWRSVRLGAALTPFHGSSNGWETAVRLAPHGEKSIVSFNGSGNAVPSPMAFGEAGRLGGDAFALPVTTIFAVVKCATPVQFSTIIDAPVDIRLTTQTTVPPSFKLSEEQLGHTVMYYVNGAETANFTPSASYQLVEVLFPSPLEPSDIFIGGAVASPSWRRGWGEIAELLFFPTPPSPQERNAVHDYVSRKWGVAVPYAPDSASPALLASLGISAGNLYNSVIIAR